MAIRSVCVFCGAKAGRDPAFVALARRVGELLAARGLELVYGGGGVGLMGALAEGALDAGGRVSGVIPRALVRREHAPRELHRLEVVESMAIRKERMIALADAFLVLPGGLGTLDELFEVLTLRQIGLHAKPLAIVDHDGYFANLMATLRGFVQAGFVAAHDLEHVLVDPRPEVLLDRLALAG